MTSAETAYLFRHALLRDAAYGLHLPSARGALHALALELLEALVAAEPQSAGPMALELADHAQSAASSEAHPPGLEARQARWLHIAAKYSHDRADYRGAIETLGRLCGLPGLDDAARAGALVRLSQVAVLVGSMTVALDAAQQAAAIAARANLPAIEGEALMRQCSALGDLGRRESSVELLRRAVVLLRPAAPARCAEALAQLAKELRVSGQLEESSLVLEEACKLAETSGDSGVVAGVFAVRAAALSESSQPAQGAAVYDRAIVILETLGARAAVAMARANLAFALAACGQADRAEVEAVTALRDARACGARRAETIVLNFLGNRHAQRHDYPAALKSYEQCLETARETDFVAYVPAALTNIALVYSDIGRLAEAITMQREAVRLQRQIGNRRGAANALSNLASALLECGQMDEAESVLNEAMREHEALNNLRYLAATLTTASKLHQKRGRRPDAIEALQRATSLFRQCGDEANANLTQQDAAKLEAGA